MSDSRKLKKQVLDDLAKHLKPLAFRRQGTTFVRQHEDVLHLIELQSSRSSTRDRVLVTVNLGVVCPQLLRSWEPPHSTSSAQWNDRLGFFSTEREDKWWSVSSEEEATKAGKEIVHILEDRGIAVLDEATSLATLREKIEHEPHGITLVQRERVLLGLDALLRVRVE